MKILKVIPFILLISCATFPSVTHTIETDQKIEDRARILEAAVEVGKSMDFPEVTEFNPENGIVQFGAFGTSVVGITAQVRIKTDNKNIDVTVNRGNAYIPKGVEETANKFKSRFQEKISKM
ncbi:hypothetical protein [Fodinibius halophilus]|uniref:DUF3568 family protein n=1 Tax=Fodinibius halophilus TaxID=1736908 RepID=A0A6M1T297_9BACT|nr:hypothetical protein [Fodinibius halophilus]NGP90198.1 hypothetical protein [Fodinibius halophilus]